MDEDPTRTDIPSPGITPAQRDALPSHGGSLGVTPESTALPAPLSPRDLRPEHFPTTASNDGRIAWIVGLVSLIPVPGLSMIATSITMIIVGRAQRGKNPVARAKGRRATLFGVVSLVSTFIFVLMGFVVIPVAESTGIVPRNSGLVWGLGVVPFGAWTVVLGPLTAFYMAIVALTDHVSELEAEKIYARDAG